MVGRKRGPELGLTDAPAMQVKLGAFSFGLTQPSGAMTTQAAAAALLGGDGGGQMIVLELLAQRDLLDLAGGGVRNLVNESDVVGKLPLGHLAFHEVHN